MILKQAKKEHSKLRIGISGASGFGKTYSALLLAKGIAGDWDKVAVIDTENGSANLYADLGPFNTLSLNAPYSPERYIKAIGLCQKAKMEVIIIDSVTHEWTGAGGCLDIHEKLGGRFQDWAQVTPRHRDFLDAILNSSAHIITTTRRKVDYSLDSTGGGRTKVVKHGTKEITREGYEYELTLNFEIINENHLAKASKDRTGLFVGKPEQILTESTGKQLLNWCQDGDLLQKAKEEILQCETLEGLRHLYGKHGKLGRQIYDLVVKRKAELDVVESHLASQDQIIQTTNTRKNGTESKRQSTADGGTEPDNKQG